MGAVVAGRSGRIAYQFAQHWIGQTRLAQGVSG